MQHNHIILEYYYIFFIYIVVSNTITHHSQIKHISPIMSLPP